MSAVEKRAHGRSPWREAFELIATRPNRGEPTSDVTITRNAKGHFQFEVTVRGADPFACRDTAIQITAHLEARFSYPVEGPVSPSDGEPSREKQLAKAASINAARARSAKATA